MRCGQKEREKKSDEKSKMGQMRNVCRREDARKSGVTCGWAGVRDMRGVKMRQRQKKKVTKQQQNN